MSHRTQITLTDAQYERLKRESARTGLGLAELVRRALMLAFGEVGNDEALTALQQSFGGWQGRELDGAAYVEQLRRGLDRRLAR